MLLQLYKRVSILRNFCNCQSNNFLRCSLAGFLQALRKVKKFGRDSSNRRSFKEEGLTPIRAQNWGCQCPHISTGLCFVSFSRAKQTLNYFFGHKYHWVVGLQWCRKVKKFGRASSKGWTESAAPGWNRVNWSAQYWRWGASAPPPALQPRSSISGLGIANF